MDRSSGQYVTAITSSFVKTENSHLEKEKKKDSQLTFKTFLIDHVLCYGISSTYPMLLHRSSFQHKSYKLSLFGNILIKQF